MDCADFVDNFTFGKSGDGGDGSKGGAGGNGGDSYGGFFCEGSTVEINNSSFVKGGRATGGAPSGDFGVASVQEGCE